MVEVRELATDLRFPEGPVVMQDGSVLVTELGGGCITRIAGNGRKSLVADLGGSPNGAAIGPDGYLYVCNNGGSRFEVVDGVWLSVEAHGVPDGWIERVDIDTGETERIYTNYEDENLSRPNDIVFDKSGGFYFTALGRDWGTHRVHGAIYYGNIDGRPLLRFAHKLITPNGVGLSPNEDRVVFAETYTSRVFSIPIETPGVASPLPFPQRAEFIGSLPSTSLFDSLAVLADGSVAVATMIDGPGLSVFNADGTVERITLPDPIVTNVAFGGDDMKTAFVTGSGYGRLLSFRLDRPGLRLNFNA